MARERSPSASKAESRRVESSGQTGQEEKNPESGVHAAFNGVTYRALLPVQIPTGGLTRVAGPVPLPSSASSFQNGAQLVATSQNETWIASVPDRSMLGDLAREIRDGGELGAADQPGRMHIRA